MKTINKKRIVTFALAGALACGALEGIKVYDAHIDHTEDICLITKVLAIPIKLNGEYMPDYTLGIAWHQWPEMHNDYAEKGIEKLAMSYESDKQGYGIRTTWGNVSYDLETGHIVYENDEFLRIRK